MRPFEAVAEDRDPGDGGGCAGPPGQEAPRLEVLGETDDPLQGFGHVQRLRVDALHGRSRRDPAPFEQPVDPGGDPLRSVRVQHPGCQLRLDLLPLRGRLAIPLRCRGPLFLLFPGFMGWEHVTHRSVPEGVPTGSSTDVPTPSRRRTCASVPQQQRVRPRLRQAERTARTVPGPRGDDAPAQKIPGRCAGRVGTGCAAPWCSTARGSLRRSPGRSPVCPAPHDSGPELGQRREECTENPPPGRGSHGRGRTVRALRRRQPGGRTAGLRAAGA